MQTLILQPQSDSNYGEETHANSGGYVFPNNMSSGRTVSSCEERGGGWRKRWTAILPLASLFLRLVCTVCHELSAHTTKDTPKS